MPIAAMPPRVSPPQYAAAVLKGIGAPVTPGNIAGFIGWAQAEGGTNWARNNPLNTTEPQGASSVFNSAGVRGYPSAQAGVAATVKTLRNGDYGGILQAFRTNQPKRLAAAIGGSPWGTSGQLAAQTIAQALKGAGRIRVPAGTLPAGATPRQTLPGAARTVGADNGNALRRYIAGSDVSQLEHAFGISGGAGPSPFDAGLLTTTPPAATQNLHVHAVGALQKLAGAPLVNTHQGARGYVNPIPGAVLGRTDMGVDATLKPGAPIRAIGNSRVVAVEPGWFQGQPKVVLRLLDGPQAGRDYYVAEQITPNVRQGQAVRAGQPIGTFAPSGTGIEIGWNASNPAQTLAQATTGYTEGQVTRAGQNFRSFLGDLQ